MTVPPGERLFFVHIQKTAGTSFRTLLDDVYGAEHVYPGIESAVVDEPVEALARYTSIHRLLADPDLDRYRAFVGHIPLAGAEMLPFPVVTATTLRHPVDRIVSLLSHLRRDGLTEEARRAPLEAFYDDPVINRVMLHEFQTRMLGVTRADVEAAGPEAALPDLPLPDAAPALQAGIRAMRVTVLRASFAAPVMFEDLDVDEAMAGRAREALGNVDVVGVLEDFSSFVERCTQVLGWDAAVVPRVNTSPSPNAVSATFRARIEADNPVDMELFEMAQRAAAVA